MYPIELSFTEAYLKEKLSADRAEHSRSVAKIAGELATLHGVDPEKARIAGLCHDLCRDWGNQKLLNYIKENNISVNEDILEEPMLAHGIVASEFLRRKLGIDDRDILDAIQSHTLGAPKMTKLQEIIFIADFVGSTKSLPKSGQVLEQAKESLGKATRMVYEMTYEYLKNKKIEINPEFASNMKACKQVLSTRK